MPDISVKACRTLYETLIDFNESERGTATYLEDEIFLQDTTYGQIHRLVELWQSFVNVKIGTILIFSHSMRSGRQRCFQDRNHRIRRHWMNVTCSSGRVLC